MAMNFRKYNSFLLALMIFYSIMPLLYKFFPIILFKPEIIMILLTAPLLFSIKNSRLISWIIVFMYSLIIFSNIIFSLSYTKSIYEFLIRIIPFGLLPAIVGILNRDEKKFNKCLIIFCNINFFLLSFLVIFRQDMYLDKNFMNYMTFGYWMLPSTLFYMYFFIIEKKKINIIFNITSIIFIFLWGSRFSFVLSLVGSIILFYSFVDKKTKKRLKILFLMLSPILIMGYTNLNNILVNLINSMDSFNMSSLSLKRLLNSITGNTSTILSGRDIIFRNTLNVISDNPFGIGLWGFKKNTILNYGEIFYPHNIFLELFLHYGIFSIVFMIAFIVITVIVIKKSKNKNFRNLIIVMIILNIKLLLTGSYLWEPYFWILITIIFTKFTQPIKKNLSFSLRKYEINK